MDADPFILLVGNLQKAADLKGNAGRESALIALGAVVEFLDSFPDIKRTVLHAPLLNLFTALADLDGQGVVHPMLIPDRRSNSLPSDRAKLHAVAAAWSEALISAGADRQAADAMVALQLKRLGYLLRGEKRDQPTHMTVRKWRGEARQSAPSGVDKEMYDQMRLAFHGMERSSLNKAIPPMLRNILPHLFSRQRRRTEHALMPPVHLAEEG
jgi:hypothetical protein